MKYVRSGQYELSKVSVITNTENPIELDFSTSFVDITIYESIYTATISGNITLVDTYNLIQRYALGQGETVIIEWNTVGINEKIRVEGVVYDLQGPNKINEHSSGFTLHFCSPEMINSIKDKVFSGHNETTSTIVSKLFPRISRKPPFTKKEIKITDTRNIESIVFTGNATIEAIRMCAKRATSNSRLSGYIFYEDTTKFNYVPIEELYQQEPISDYVYRNNAAYNNVANAHEESFNTIQDFERLDCNKMIDDLMDGQYGSSWAYLSLNDKSLNVFSYDMKTSFKESNSLGKTPVVLDRNFNPLYSDKLTISYGIDHEQNEPFVHENSLKLLKTNSIIFNIGVFGNSSLKVGSVIETTIPSYSSESFREEGIDIISGKFLISEIKHVLTPKLYNQRIQIIKDAFEESIS